jgi:hypothetical protein
MFIPNEVFAFASGIAAALGANRLRRLHQRRRRVAPEESRPEVMLAPELETEVDEAAHRWAEASGSLLGARVAAPFVKEFLRTQSQPYRDAADAEEGEVL